MSAVVEVGRKRFAGGSKIKFSCYVGATVKENSQRHEIQTSTSTSSQLGKVSARVFQCVSREYQGCVDVALSQKKLLKLTFTASNSVSDNFSEKNHGTGCPPPWISDKREKRFSHPSHKAWPTWQENYWFSGSGLLRKILMGVKLVK